MRVKFDPGQCWIVQGYGLKSCQESKGIRDPYRELVVRSNAPDDWDGKVPCAFFSVKGICGGARIQKAIKAGKFPRSGIIEARRAIAREKEMESRPTSPPPEKVSPWYNLVSRFWTWLLNQRPSDHPHGDEGNDLR